jgi:putative N-acetylmannosamine-6-phosphate epimerase
MAEGLAAAAEMGGQEGFADGVERCTAFRAQETVPLVGIDVTGSPRSRIAATIWSDSCSLQRTSFRPWAMSSGRQI